MKNQDNHSMAFSKDTVEEVKVIDFMPHKQLLETLPVAAYSCDHLGKLNYYNEHASELWGVSPSLGKPNWSNFWKFYKMENGHLELKEEPLAKAILEGKLPGKEEFVIERTKGGATHLISCPKLIYDNNKNIVGGYNLLIDVSGLYNSINEAGKHAMEYKALSKKLSNKLLIKNQSLDRNEERYHKMIEEVQDYAILLLDIDGTIMNWNKGAEKIKGYKEGEIIGKNFRIFYLDEDRENKLPEKLINIARNEGKAMQEGWRKRKDGSKFWGFIVITALHDSENNVVGFSKVTRDLSERKANEDKLKLYAKNIEVKNKQLEEYAYVASHDLQEPLRKIQIFTELLQKDIDKKKNALGHIKKIHSSAKRMSLLIKDVLKYSQLSKPDELWAKINLNEVLQNVHEDYDLLITEKNADFSIDLLPIITGIPIQMHQLFSNLIGNALKFTSERPRIEVLYSMVSKNEVPDVEAIPIDSNYHRIDVKDNGPGFEPRFQEHVFKLFKRLDKNKQGTGIGLALCQKIVENHKGFIKVASERDKGTTFSIYLPI